jgi:hypothetical protein
VLEAIEESFVDRDDEILDGCARMTLDNDKEEENYKCKQTAVL